VARKDPQVVQSGERTNTDGKPVSNIILLSISDSDYRCKSPVGSGETRQAAFGYYKNIPA